MTTNPSTLETNMRRAVNQPVGIMAAGKRRNSQPLIAVSVGESRGKGGRVTCEAKPKVPEIYLEGEILAMDPEVPEIHKVVLKGDIESLKELVEAGTDINAPDPDGWPPLHTAIKSGQLECASFLIKHGASDFFERQQEEYMKRLNTSGRLRTRFQSL